MLSITMSRLTAFSVCGGREAGRKSAAAGVAAAATATGCGFVCSGRGLPVPDPNPGVVGVVGTLKTADLFWYPVKPPRPRPYPA